MADAVTNNRNLTQPQVGGDAGTWGGILNSGVMGQLDFILGGTQSIAITSADVTLSITQWNNCAINLTGALTGNHNLILPFNANSSSVAVGGLFVVANNTTGAYNVTVITQAGGTGVVVPQGSRAFLYSDTANVWFADDARFQFIEYAGNPNGNVAGVAGTVNNPPSVVWDYTDSIPYFCTTTGTAGSAVWSNVILNTVNANTTFPTPQGYLTPQAATAIIPSDVVGATTIYYTPYTGPYAAVHNGTAVVPYRFAQSSFMNLTLSSSQAANNIYDIYLVYNGGAPTIGSGPSWVAGSGGSITPGSCVRGTGTGGASITRDAASGLWVNANAMTVICNANGAGNTPVSVSAGQGVLLGSIYVDATPGQVSCYRSWGQNRKWGVSNVYNRVPAILQVGDSTSSWTYNSATIRPSNNSTANSLTTFSCLAEETAALSFVQNVQSLNPNPAQFNIGVGINSTTAFSGFSPDYVPSPSNTATVASALIAAAVLPPSLGINTITCLEKSTVSGGTNTLVGTNANMVLSAQWNV